MRTEKKAAGVRVVPSPAGSHVRRVQPPRVDVDMDREEVARLAYSYWEARGCGDGLAEEDWLRAEQELQSRK